MPLRNNITSVAELKAIPPGDNEYYFEGTEPYNHAWKLHLCLNEHENVYPDLHDPLIRNVSSYLIDNGIPHKYANGGDGFKTYTIYTGTPEKNFTVAHALNERFAFPERSKSLESGDLYLANSIYTRFEGQPYEVPGVALSDGFFMHYGLHGIPMVNNRQNYMPELPPEKMTKSNKALLHTLIGHAFCARRYGKNYLGQHYDKTQWDHGIFTSLGDTFSLHEIQTYINRALDNPLPHKLTTHLMTTQPVDIDIEKLTNANNEPKSQYGINTQNIIGKMHKPSGTILSRAHEPVSLMDRIAAKWDKKPR